MPAAKGNQYAKGNRGGKGNVTDYEPRFAKMAKKVALLGATDKQLAGIFEVEEATINRWKLEHEEFARSLKEGKSVADAEVAKSLYGRARGYKHKAVKIFADPKSGQIVEVPYIERYPPDTTACIFWLKNRRPDLWRDRHQFEFDLTKLSEEQLARIAGGEDPIAVVASTQTGGAPGAAPPN